MGVVVVGPSGSGKTILWKLLRTALGKLDQVVKQYTMNPKAMPRTQVCFCILPLHFYIPFPGLKRNLADCFQVYKYKTVPRQCI